MSIGRQRKVQRLLGKAKYSLILPIDHGFTSGPIEGIECVSELQPWMSSPLIHGIIAHKGVVERLYRHNLVSAFQSMILHLNGSPLNSTSTYKKELLTDVDMAFHLDCDAVSIDLNFVPNLVSWNMCLLGKVVDDAHRKGLPVLVMVSDRSDSVNDENYIKLIRSYIRGCIEMGADIVKINIPLDRDDQFYEQIFNGIAKDIPIMIAGGGKSSPQLFIDQVKRVLKHPHIKGICVGRNLFQSSDPLLTLNALSFNEKELLHA